MRPKLLEIEGLQSFRDVQRIDFEALSETGLFGIFGPTGSGKSTVLDAITFALYGKIKRADGGTQGIINTHHKTARVSFTFELIREGIRRNYRVERVYQRKKDSPVFGEAKVARLIEISEAGEIPLCDKANDVSNTIKELLGLSHEDFTRAVVLPQNSFQEFLLLNNADRRGMLERIFYLEEYGKQLTEKLTRKMTGLKSRIDTLFGELKGYEDASDEALLEAQKARDEAVAERDKAVNDLKKTELQYKEAKEVWELVQDLSQVLDKEKEHLSLQEKMAQKKACMEKAQKAEGLVPSLQTLRALTEKLAQTENELGLILQKLPMIQTELGESDVKYQTLKQEISHEQPRLLSLKARLEDALGIKAELTALVAQINELNGGAAQIREEKLRQSVLLKEETEAQERLDKELVALKTKTDGLKIAPEYRQTIQEGAKLEKDAQALNEKVVDLENQVISLKNTQSQILQKLTGVKGERLDKEKALELLNLEKQGHDGHVPGDKAEILRKTERLHSFQAVYDILCFHKKGLDTLRKKQSDLQDALGELIQKKMRLNEEKNATQAVFEMAKLALDNAVDELNRNTAHRLSQTLKAGEPCPVCGSEHHPKPASGADMSDAALLEQRIQQAKHEVEAAEQRLKEAETAVLLLEEKMKALTEQNQLLSHEISQRTQDYSAEQAKLPEVLRALELEGLKQELERMSQISAEKLKAIEVWEKEQEAIKEKLQKLNEALNGYRLTEHGMNTELKVNQDGLTQLEKSLLEAQKIAHSVGQQYMDFLQNHHLKSGTAELNRLAEMDRQLHGLQKHMEQVTQQSSQKRILVEAIKEKLQGLNSTFIQKETELKSLASQRDAMALKLRELAGEASIEQELKAIDEKLSAYGRLENDCHERLQMLEKQVNGLENQKALLMNQQSIFNESQSKERESLKKALGERGFLDQEEVEDALLPQSELKALKNEIEAYEQKGFNLRANRDMIQKKLNERHITEAEWKQLNTAYQEIAAYKEACVSRSEVAKSRYDQLSLKHDKWATLNASYQGLTHKQGLFEQIQKVLRAELRKDNSFIDYIAEERLRYVAAKASETLGLMTKYKYGLELDTEAGFIIRDNANGGVCRKVTSLSGGETFLTSLSLALALSEQIQLKGQSPLEFFFLDEGFGTLDNSLLDTVIDALERLSKRERVIGLISHVPELRSRIGRRLVIDPPTAQGEGSRVKIEKA